MYCPAKAYCLRGFVDFVVGHGLKSKNQSIPNAMNNDVLSLSGYFEFHFAKKFETSVETELVYFEITSSASNCCRTQNNYFEVWVFFVSTFV